jgi:putative transposase
VLQWWSVLLAALYNAANEQRRQAYETVARRHGTCRRYKWTGRPRYYLSEMPGGAPQVTDPDDKAQMVAAERWADQRGYALSVDKNGDVRVAVVHEGQRRAVPKGTKTGLPTWAEQIRQIKHIRAQIPEYAAVPADLLYVPIRRLERSYKEFFRRCKQPASDRGKNGKPGLPRFFSARHRFFTMEFRGHGSAGLKSTGSSPRRLGLPAARGQRKMSVKLCEDPPPGPWSTIRLRTENGRPDQRFEMIIGYQRAIDRKPRAGVAGTDLGIRDLATTIDDRGVVTRRRGRLPSAGDRARIDKLRAKIDACRPGSRRHRHLSRRLRQENTELRRRTTDHLHKCSTALTSGSEYETLYYGDLRCQDLPRDSYQQPSRDRKLNRAKFNEWSPYRLKQMLAYKLELYGMDGGEQGEEWTTQTCARCGHTKEGGAKMTLDDRVYRCCECGLVVKRTINNAANILALGSGMSSAEVLARSYGGGTNDQRDES